MLADPDRMLFGSVSNYVADPRFTVVRQMEDSFGGWACFTTQYEDIVKSFEISSKYSPSLRKNSEFSPLFNYHLLKNMQGGLIPNEVAKAMRDGHPEPGRDWEVKDAPALSISNLFFPLLVISGGAGLALVLVVAEFIGRKINSLCDRSPDLALEIAKRKSFDDNF